MNGKNGDTNIDVGEKNGDDRKRETEQSITEMVEGTGYSQGKEKKKRYSSFLLFIYLRAILFVNLRIFMFSLVDF